MDNRPLTPDEIEKLRALLPVAEIVRQEAEYQAAWRLVLKRWKAIVVWVAALIGAVIIIRDFVLKSWQGFAGG